MSWNKQRFNRNQKRQFKEQLSASPEDLAHEDELDKQDEKKAKEKNPLLEMCEEEEEKYNM